MSSSLWTAAETMSHYPWAMLMLLVEWNSQRSLRRCRVTRVILEENSLIKQILPLGRASKVWYLHSSFSSTYELRYTCLPWNSVSSILPASSSWISTKLSCPSQLLKFPCCFLSITMIFPSLCTSCRGTRLVRNQKVLISCILSALYTFILVSSSPTAMYELPLM